LLQKKEHALNPFQLLKDKHLSASEVKSEIIQLTTIKDIGAAKKTAIVGENHGNYNRPEFRNPERKACDDNNLEYKLEHEEIPLRREILEEKGSISDSSASRNHLIRPDDKFFRIAYQALSILKALEERNMKDAKYGIDCLRAEFSNNNEVKEASRRAIEIKYLEQLEKAADLNLEAPELTIEAIKEKYGFLLSSIKFVYEGTPDNYKDHAAGLAKGNGQTQAHDIVSKHRSIKMYIAVNKWVDLMNPTIFKVGGEHVEDMKNLLRLPGLPEPNLKLHLINEGDATDFFNLPTTKEEARVEPSGLPLIPERAKAKVKARARTTTQLPGFHR
jgi:hypothetical protein